MSDMKKVFLDDSTILQQAVLKFLTDQMRQFNNGPLEGTLRYVFQESFSKDEYEDDLVFETDEYVIKGHPDAIIDIIPKGKRAIRSVVEIKCLSSSRFRTLKQKGSWRQKFWQYYVQAQVYANLAGVEQTAMLFKNRDTGEMIGGLGFIDSEAYTFDREMIVPRSAGFMLQIQDKLDRITFRPEEISECDAVGYCFHCESFGLSKSEGRVVWLDHTHKDYGEIYQHARNFDLHKSTLMTQFKFLEGDIQQLRPFFTSLKASGGIEVYIEDLDKTIFVPNPGRKKLTEFL